MSFEAVDRIPLMEMGFWTETLERWHHEGLPKWVTHDRPMEVRLGTKLPPTWPGRRCRSAALRRSGWVSPRRSQLPRCLARLNARRPLCCCRKGGRKVADAAKPREPGPGIDQPSRRCRYCDHQHEHETRQHQMEPSLPLDMCSLTCYDAIVIELWQSSEPAGSLAIEAKPSAGQAGGCDA